MIDYILLFPYYLALKLRHFFYDHAWKKVEKSPVRTIGIGNLTVGGTGKTPHAEMVIRMLSEDPEQAGQMSPDSAEQMGHAPEGQMNIALLSRGYKRKLGGFQVLPHSPNPELFGDEPSQIKNKFPYVTVAVDSNRIRGCNALNDPEKFLQTRKGRKCRFKDFPKADVIVLDDVLQYRRLQTDLSILLVDFSHPVFMDKLMPLGRLRDLRERVGSTDVIIVTKCPFEMNGFDRGKWAYALGLHHYDVSKCRDEKGKYLFFTDIAYDEAMAVFPEGDSHYLYSTRAIVFTGIADDSRFCKEVRIRYQMVGHLGFPDHHSFSSSNIRDIFRQAKAHPTAVILTTEKDCQRIRQVSKMPEELKKRMFYIPIRSKFLDSNQEKIFKTLLKTDEC